MNNDKIHLIDHKFGDLLNTLAEAKPNDRSGLDRAFAIVITSVQTAYALFFTYILNNANN